MTLEFVHQSSAQRVRFGAGRVVENIADEIAERGATRVMLIASTEEAGLAAPIIARISPVLVWDEVVQHVPIEVAVRARAAAVDAGIDLLISLGGGSATGLAKAIAMETRLPIVAVPTTYAGSEATNVWGLTEAARKTTGIDDAVLPSAVIYDAELTLTLPLGLSVASALNGIAHCVDSLWAPRANPINAALAGEGLRAIAAGAQAIVKDPVGLPGREEAQYGAYLAGVAFASAGSGMHHKICHVLGGTFSMPHAETHAVVLPYVTAFNVDSAPDAERRIADALGADDAVSGLQSLYAGLSAPTNLADLGLRETDIAEAVSIALPSIPPSNPRTVDAASLTSLLHAAWSGAPVTTVRG